MNSKTYRDDTFCSRKRERQHLRLILGEVTANHRPKKTPCLETGRHRNQAPAKPLLPEQAGRGPRTCIAARELTLLQITPGHRFFAVTNSLFLAASDASCYLLFYRPHGSLCLQLSGPLRHSLIKGQATPYPTRALVLLQFRPSHTYLRSGKTYPALRPVYRLIQGIAARLSLGKILRT